MASRLARLRGNDDAPRSGQMSLAEYEAMVNGSMGFAGNSYPLGLQTLYGGLKGEDIGVGLPGYVRAALTSPPVFGAQLTRSLVLSQAGFAFKGKSGTPEAGKFSYGGDLDLLDVPWPKGSLPELVTKLEWHAGLAGNAFVHRTPNRLRVLRPDWVVIIFGSYEDSDHPEWQLDAEVLGYAYYPGGITSGAKPIALYPEDVMHWAPLPDPLAIERGMSWLTPVIREIQSDNLATLHQTKFFEHGATPNLVIKGVPAPNQDRFDELVEMMEQQHGGIRNAYRTLYLTAGADAMVVGANLKDIDLKTVHAAAETRISLASRVPAPVLGTSEGLAGSALNAGNWGQARRSFADGWLYPTLTSLTSAFGQIIEAPDGKKLAPITDDMPFVREDGKDAAEIREKDAITIRTLVDAGMNPDAAVRFVTTGDRSELLGQHSGLFSVQLQTPTTGEPPAAPASEASNV